MFRVLRPLRAINRAKGLKVISFVFHFAEFLTKSFLKTENHKQNENTKLALIFIIKGGKQFDKSNGICVGHLWLYWIELNWRQLAKCYKESFSKVAHQLVCVRCMWWTKCYTVMRFAVGNTTTYHVRTFMHTHAVGLREKDCLVRWMKNWSIERWKMMNMSIVISSRKKFKFPLYTLRSKQISVQFKSAYRLSAFQLSQWAISGLIGTCFFFQIETEENRLTTEHRKLDIIFRLFFFFTFQITQICVLFSFLFGISEICVQRLTNWYQSAIQIQGKSEMQWGL